MGNHEFCGECGQDDFHIGRPCDPIKYKEYQEKINEREEEKIKKITKMQNTLNNYGLKYKLSKYGNAMISWCDF